MTTNPPLNPHDVQLDRWLNDAGWGLLLMLTGVLWLLPSAAVPPGTWLFGVAVILFTVSIVRYVRHIAVNRFSLFIGAAALLGAISQLWRVDPPLVAIFLIAIGASLVARPFIARTTVVILFMTLAMASPVLAQVPVSDESRSAGQTPSRASDRIELPKDPVVATYFSATLPGLGQIYNGDRLRGVLFLTSIVGSSGAAYASYEPARLRLADYDNPLYGGNGDGQLSTGEASNWENRTFEDTAFERLTNGRKAGLITGATVGAVLYVWNVIDAHKGAHEHNRQLAQRRVNVGLQVGQGRTGVAVGVTF